MKKINRVFLLLLFLQSIHPQTVLISEKEFTGADAYELPNISPENDMFMIMASKAYEGTSYLKWKFHNENHTPSRLFTDNKKKKKNRRGRKISRSILEEYLAGWLTYDGVQYLYAVLNDIGSEPIKSTMYSFPIGNQSQEIFEEFQTSSPNTPNVSKVLNDLEGIIISYLNGPFGYHHYVFDDEGVVIPNPTFFELPGPVQSISQWKNNDVLILEGQENIYHLWTSNSSGKWKPSRLNISLTDYTIFGSVNCHPENNNIFSFLASTDDRMKTNKADLCIYNLKTGTVIKKIEVYAPTEPYRGTKYAQWSRKYNRIYFLRQNDKEHIKSFYFDMESYTTLSSGIPDNRIKSFALSVKGDILATIAYPSGGLVRIYSIDD